MEIQIKKVDDPALMQMISELSVKTFYETYGLFNTAKNMLDYTNTYFSPESLLGQNFVRTLHLDFSENPISAHNSFKINEIKHEKG